MVKRISIDFKALEIENQNLDLITKIYRERSRRSISRSFYARDESDSDHNDSESVAYRRSVRSCACFSVSIFPRGRTVIPK